MNQFTFQIPVEGLIISLSKRLHSFMYDVNNVATHLIAKHKTMKQKITTYHGGLMYWALISMSIARALSSDGQVPKGVEIPSQGCASSEGEVGDGHQVWGKNPQTT
jgi:hypothetical protein